MQTLITADELHSLLGSAEPPHVLDVRWRLDQPDGSADHRAGHIPGAVYVDLDHELSDHGRPAVAGRHPLPRHETLQQAARRWGLLPGRTVVVHDDLRNLAAARAWWLLRRAGVRDVRVLDGALEAWRRAGLPLEEGDVRPEPSTIRLQDPQRDVTDTAAAAAVDLESVRDLSSRLSQGLPADAVLLDVRAPERFRGEHEPIDPRAGHIPGARNLPTAGNVDAAGRFLTPQALRERLLAAGADDHRPVVSYCGSGVNAAHATLAAHLAGFDAVLYPGSFSQWSQHAELEVAVGE
ncbi:sulfurtransferase [Nesterenkonia sp. PF2B19]|uniref:sulfurtransferase n=1 Tax=Nesterenkonia sp. PF2B19 TaxID=1881858 RepID=UPI0009F2CBA6|nr:sulfurtransferase [Nesterenkonia sp. PF2B19]OSM43369.1 sulfurtransferase [Nesterenkonia sp. PF2B19]